MRKRYLFEQLFLSALIITLLLIAFIFIKTAQSVWVSGLISFLLVSLSLWLFYSLIKTKNQSIEIPIMKTESQEAMGDALDIKEEIIIKLMDLYQKEDVFKVIAKLVSDYLKSKSFKIILCNQDQQYLLDSLRSTQASINLNTELLKIDTYKTSYELNKELKESLSTLKLVDDYLVLPFFSLKNLEGLIIIEAPLKDRSLYSTIRFIMDQARIILDRCRPYQEIRDEYKKTLALAEKMKHQAAFATLSRGISHEIKNPLGQLKLWADIVFEKPDDKEKIQEFAKTTSLVMTRLKDMVEAMLKYKEADSGLKDYFDLEEVIKDVLALSEPTCGLGNYMIKVSKNFGSVPKAYGDRLFIYFSIMNLMVNAMEHTPKNGEIIITTSTGHYISSDGKNRSGVIFKIQDTGAGIPEENLEKIFDPFFTTGVSNGPNAGIGLSLVFRVITSNSGKIEVTSEVGKGSCFTMYLPVSL